METVTRSQYLDIKCLDYIQESTINMIAYGKIMLQFYTYMHIKLYLYEMNDVIIRLICGFFFVSQSKKILKFSSD